ncbi:FAD binding domain-containing protein [Thermogemmatispora sp.]|uniref:FAD binding domain-containing protein n=1 Tax=Thermogemmatispora sp. TaxID=1968838 RepID=UPI001DD9C10B|nr:FAD binding domain-containing protein [Thermogemmatispora sp.]MBX5449170.1 FAD binding domain-containing protein [Thermogemmatispora sp.]
MARHIPAWLAPTSLEEALELRARYGEEATVVAGGTFVGILMNQGLLQPAALLTLRQIPQLAYLRIEDADASGQPLLRIGAMTTHRALERSPLVQRGWPVLAATFALVASPRVRNQATVGGVLADADYASDPPALLHALEASVVARSLQGERLIPVEELIIGHYETSLRPDELLTEVRVPRTMEGAVYRKFRSRSSEDRPCVAVAAVRRRGRLRVVVGAVAERPQYFPEICALAEGQAPIEAALAREIGERYAAAIEPISDARGSAHYRRRVIAVEVRRALEDLNRIIATEGGSQRHA